MPVEARIEVSFFLSLFHQTQFNSNVYLFKANGHLMVAFGLNRHMTCEELLERAIEEKRTLEAKRQKLRKCMCFRPSQATQARRRRIRLLRSKEKC